MPTSTLLSITIIPSPLPIEPTISIFTPDPIQVEKWKEYETALAKTLLSFLPTEKVLCEWEILGQSAQEVYLWTVCAGLGVSGVSSAASVPVVVHVEVNGAVQSVEIPGDGTAYTRDILKMFPADVREKFEDYNSGRAGKMSEHIEWRRTHPEEPPLIVLSTTPTP